MRASLENTIRAFNLPLIFLTVLGSLHSLCAADRSVTMEVNYGAVGVEGTNILRIASFETAELLSFPVVSTPRRIWFQKSNGWYLYQDDRPLVIAGPATIELRGYGGIATFRISPGAYSPDKALLIAPGPGGAEVTLERSTNLVDWAVAENGVYTNNPVATFFRIRAVPIHAH